MAGRLPILAIVVLSIRIDEGISTEKFECKARVGCHFSGCDPSPDTSRKVLNRNEFPITCQATPDQSQTSALQDQNLLTLLLGNLKRSAKLTEMVDNLEKSRAELLDMTSELRNKSREMTVEIERLKNQVSGLTKKSNDLMQARASDLGRLIKLEQKLHQLMSQTAAAPEVTTIAATSSTKAEAVGTSIRISSVQFYHWTSWTDRHCSPICGRGRLTRVRKCIDGYSGEFVTASQCNGASEDSNGSCYGRCNAGGPYPRSFHCDFETFWSDCGYFSNLDKGYHSVYWLQHLPNSPSPFLFSVSALQTSEGYMYVDASPDNERHAFAHLRTKLLAAVNYCIQTSVFMTADGVGSLKVNVLEYKGEWLDKRTLRTIQPREFAGKRWIAIRENFKSHGSTNHVQVEYEAWRSAKSSRYKPIIAIDNIRIVQGQC